MISKDKRVLKIADFGFAKIIGNDTLAETLCGSPLYMAPEILHKKPYTSKADLWSVGVMLYEALCGQHPFKSVTSVVDLVHKVDNDVIPFPSSSNISVLGRDILKRLLKKDPYERIGWDEFFNHKWFGMACATPGLTSSINSSSDVFGSGSFAATRTESRFPQPQSRPIPFKPIASSPRGGSSPIAIITDYAAKTKSRESNCTSNFSSSPMNNSINSNRMPNIMAMSPPSFINSPVIRDVPMVPLKIIDNYVHPNQIHSTPILAFESAASTSTNKSRTQHSNCSSDSKKDEYSDNSQASQSTHASQSKSLSYSLSDYVGTSLKMLKDSFQSQSLHSAP